MTRCRKGEHPPYDSSSDSAWQTSCEVVYTSTFFHIVLSMNRLVHAKQSVLKHWGQVADMEVRKSTAAHKETDKGLGVWEGGAGMGYQSWLLMASPYPGVSTTVRRSLTPRSSISTVEASICTVRSIFSTCRTKKEIVSLTPPMEPQMLLHSGGTLLFYTGVGWVTGNQENHTLFWPLAVKLFLTWIKQELHTFSAGQLLLFANK